MKKLSLCWMVTLWICSIFSVKAQTTIYEHGAEITSISQIKEGTLFVMKKGSEYLCSIKPNVISLQKQHNPQERINAVHSYPSQPLIRSVISSCTRLSSTNYVKSKLLNLLKTIEFNNKKTIYSIN